MGDADDSYDFSEVPKFVAKWREGNEFVMGNRFSGGIQPGAMPTSHKLLGNPGAYCRTEPLLPGSHRRRVLWHAGLYKTDLQNH